MFVGQLWLDPLNSKAYFPAILIINSMLTLWFSLLARHARDNGFEE